MQWLSADFAQERRWKRGVARKVCLQLGLLFISFQVCFAWWMDWLEWNQTEQCRMFINAHNLKRQALTSQVSWPWLLFFFFNLRRRKGSALMCFHDGLSFPQVVRMVIRHHEEQRQKEERARREEQAKLRRIASTMAKDVRQFWSNVEKVGSRDWERKMLWIWLVSSRNYQNFIREWIF